MNALTPKAGSAARIFTILLIILVNQAVFTGCSSAHEEGAPAAAAGPSVDPISAPSETSISSPLPTTTVAPAAAPPAVEPTADTAPLAAPSQNRGATLILSPGSESIVTTPLKPQIMVRVHPGGIVIIDLLGRGGLVYARHLLDLSEQAGQEILLQPELPFETQDGSEPARLVVRLLDEAGRTVTLTSASLTLQTGGVESIEPSGASGWIEIISPLEGEKVEGKKARVIASVLPVNEQPVVAELITEKGTSINTRLVRLPVGSKPGESIHLDFELPYAADGPTPALLALYQASYNQIEGKLMLSSVPVVLYP